MKILAFDSTAANFSVALLLDQKILSKNIITESGKQAELLIPQIEKVLSQNNIWYQDLDLIAATQGPGSFTGTRIGLTVARTIKLATNLPLILINSCQAIAYKYRQKSEKIFVVIDAKADEFFYAEFDQKTNEETAPKLAKLEELAQIFPQEKFFLCGSGKKIAAKILEEKKYKFEITNCEDEVEADLVGLLAYEKFKNGEKFSTDLNPIYLRSPRISERKK
ncbi:MAG: tRNA (adenosine(37)-N6)-threonylcarbamoyltransferase complex dimerization subunit type 1 TsaB [Rickettsiales bacterium]|nr:tRNA (adenosine(37)-N6)-threonylcarbamoyltransferase complex dimerization subunit type 1 TsaB [Rickettsiales bacterium]